MKKFRIFFILSALVGGTSLAQNQNLFHSRDFWKTNPSIEIIEQKITEENDISKLNKNAFDGAVYAILENTDISTIKHLLSKKNNPVNKKTHDGRTYIFWAAYKNNLKLIKYLVSKGAKTNLIDSHGYTVLNFAVSAGQTDIKMYDYLIKMGANIKTDKNHKGANALLLVAPYLKNFDLVTFLLSQGASLQDTDNNGDGLFAYAAKGGNVKFLKTLIKKRIATGENAMIFASQGLRRKKNSLETYKFLESVGVKPNAVDTSGRNSLHAIAYNNKDLATYSYFISRGTDVNLQDHEGNTPFMNAANSNTLKVIKYLSKTVKDINLKDANGRSALTKAVQRNTLDVVAFLLVQKADINSLDDKGNSLSYYLIQTFDAKNLTNFEEKRALLEKNGLVINSPQNSGNTLLHIATSKDNLALLKRLSSFNINVNKQNEDGLSALQIAAMTSKNIDIINYLISIGAHKNIKTAFGETIYDLALENEILMKNNIDLHFLK